VNAGTRPSNRRTGRSPRWSAQCEQLMRRVACVRSYEQFRKSRHPIETTARGGGVFGVLRLERRIAHHGDVGHCPGMVRTGSGRAFRSPTSCIVHVSTLRIAALVALRARRLNFTDVNYAFFNNMVLHYQYHMECVRTRVRSSKVSDFFDIRRCLCRRSDYGTNQAIAGGDSSREFGTTGLASTQCSTVD